jgi:hypothetical protein
MGAVSSSAKNQIAMSLSFERDELGDEFVLTVPEQVGVIDETEMFFIRFGLRKVQPEEFWNELLAGVVRHKKYGVNKAFVVASIEREGPDQAGLRGRR